LTEETLYQPSPKQMRADIMKLAWPCALEFWLHSIISLVTVGLIGYIGKEAVSAISITNQPIMIPNVVMQAFCVGGTAVVARELGQHNLKKARNGAAQTLFLAGFSGLLIAILMFFFGKQLILWMGATPDYIDMAEVYMRYCAIGVFFTSITTALSALFRGCGKTRMSMYASVTANLANALIGYLLIYGVGPLPSLGVQGAGIAHLCAKMIGAGVALVLFFKGHLPIQPKIKEVFRPTKDIIGRICRVGVPTGLEQVVMRVGLIMFTVYVVRLGTVDYAAHSIASSIHDFVVNFGSAVGVALVSLVGQNLGAGRPDLAEGYFKESIKLCIFASVFFMAPLIICPKVIAGIFTNDLDVIEAMVVALRILALFTTAQILQMALAGGLRGGGDTKWPLYATIVGVWGMRMVLGYFFIIVFHWGLAGAWICWGIDQYVRAFVIWLRCRSGKWKVVKV